MVKTRAIVTLLAAMALASTFVACDEKDPDNSEFNPGSIPYDESQTDRAYLEETAAKLLDLFVPRDQSYLLGVLKRFADICDNSEFPENFDDDYTALAGTSRALSDALASYDGASISRAVGNFAYSIARFKGLYQHNSNTNKWQYIEDNDNVIFRFWNGKNEYNISLSGTDGSWQEIVSTDDGVYTIDVPKTISLLLVDGSISLKPEYIMSADIRTDGKDGSHLNVKTQLTAANIVVESNYESTNTQAKQLTTLSVDNTKTLYRTRATVATSEVVGQGLCSAKSWVAVDRSGDPADALGRIISSASSTVMVMDRVQFKTKVYDLTAVINNIDGWWDSSDGNPEGKARQAAKTLTNSMSTDVYYANNTQNNPVRAKLSWEAYKPYEEWDDYDEWTVRPLITFTSDNTPYDFESYFGNGRFLSIENQFNSLMSTYQYYWQ